MKPQWRHIAITGGLTVVLLGSLALNCVLYRQATDHYRQLQGLRLDPLGLSHYGAAPDPQEIPASGSTVVVFFGDSRAADWPAPDLDGFLFVNRGIHAETSAQALGRFARHVAPLEPDIVVVQVGINDLKAMAMLPEQRDVIVANCRENVRQIVERSTALGARVLLTTIFPTGPIPPARRPFWSEEVAVAIEEINTALRAVEGNSVSVLDTHALLADEQGHIRPEYSRDLLHLTDAGYRRLDEALVSHLRGLSR